MVEPDVIVIGAGAAGAVVAARLSEDAHCRVLLVEAGGPARGPLFSVPLATGALLRGRLANWGFVTEPEAELNGRRIAWPRGKGLGGSTAINGMVYMRGLPSDYDGWAQAGLPGWGHADVLELFKRAEASTIGDDALHGREGPVTVTRGRRANPLFDVYLEAAAAAGQPRTDDFNGAAPHGAGPYDFTIRAGRRVSTARAYLDRARGRPNLAVLTRVHVARIVVERGRATGIEVVARGRTRRIAATREVVLCAGAVGSPHILMLSGVGPADELGAHGIAVNVDLPGVGKNLQDHVMVRIEHAATGDVTIDRLRRLDRAAAAFLEAWAFGTGPASTFPLEVGGLYKSDEALDLPDLQSHFLPGLSSAAIRVPFIGMKVPPDRGAGFFANVFQMRPTSRGEITLASADPFAAPLIRPRYLSAAPDRAVLREGIRRVREIFAAAPFDRYRGPELSPGADARSDADLDRFIAATADTVYHPAGTCRMGPAQDRLAVVDATLKLAGVEGLRVADASVMPTITSSNTAAPTIMIGERCADLIRAAT